MLYFIKDNTLHRYPVPERCSVQRGKEILRDTVPHDVDQCNNCLGRWPEKRDKR